MEFIVAVEDPNLRTRLVRILRSIENEPAIVGDAREAYRLNPQQLNQGWLLLETGDNAHRLTQVVNDLHYSPWFEGGSVPVTCFVSRLMFEQNPTLGFWLIAGGAAVGRVWAKEMPDGEIASGLRWVGTARKEDRALEERPDIALAVHKVAEAPDQATGWLETAELLVERQDVWETRRELAEALLRKALDLDPNCARARVRLAKVLFWGHQHSAAMDECRTAIRLDPDYAEAHYQLGSILGFGHHPEQARPHLKTAIRLAGDSLVGVWAKNTLDSLGRR